MQLHLRTDRVGCIRGGGIELRAVNLCTMSRGEGGGEGGAQADDGRPWDWDRGGRGIRPDDENLGIMILESLW